MADVGQRALESQLTSALHSVELLKAEIEKEEHALEHDRSVLSKLEANAKAEERSQKHQATKVMDIEIPRSAVSKFRTGSSTVETSGRFSCSNR